MSCFFRDLLSLGSAMGRNISMGCFIFCLLGTSTVTTLFADVRLERPKNEYQHVDGNAVLLALSFVNETEQDANVGGSWRWIDHEQRMVARGVIKTEPLPARGRIPLDLKLPVGSSKHYKLEFDWTDGGETRHDVVDLVTDAPAARRPALLLSGGGWEAATSEGFWPFEMVRRAEVPAIPEGLGWKPVVLPHGIGATLDAKGTIHWFRRKIELPGWLRGDTYELVFQGIGKRAHVWVNGKHIAYLEGAWTSYALDVSQAINPDGNNEILVAAADHTAQKQDPARGNRYNWSVGHSGNAFAGIYDHVWLRATGAVRVRNWNWNYDSEAKTLNVGAVVENLSAADIAGDAVLQVRLLDEAGKAVYSAQADVAVPAGKDKRQTVKLDVAGAKLWWPAMTDAPGKPHLYGIEVNVLRKGTLVDQITDRVGLRDLVVRDGLYVINGIPLHPVARGMGGWTGARSWANARHETAPGYGDFSRLHCNPLTHNVVEAAEENGHLIQIETGFTASGYGYPMNDLDFWTNFRTHTRQLIDEYRNSTAVISLSLCNEVFLCGAESFKNALDNMASVWRMATDDAPGWPVVVNGDGDLRGRIDTVNLHYPRHLSRHPLLPMDAYWLQHDTPQKLDLYPGGFTWKTGQLLEIGEDQWDGFSAWPHGCAILQGDSAYVSEKSAQAGHDAAATLYMLGYRDAGVAYHQPWSRTSMAAREYAFQPIAAYLVDSFSTVRPGTSIRWQVNVFNDSMREQTLTLRARSAAFDVMYPHAIKIPPAGKQRVVLEIPVSAKTADGDVSWQLTLADSRGEIRFTDEHVLRIRSVPELVQPRVPIFVVEGSGRLAARLGSLKLEFSKLSSWSQLDPLKAGLLLVDEEAPLAAMNAGDRVSLSRFVTRGGKAVFFEQSRYPTWWVAPMRLSQDTFHDATVAHVLASDHALLAGLESEDFQYWPDDHLVSRADFFRPESDGALALLADGGRIGLGWSPLVLQRSGDGWYLFSQLNLLKAWDKHPSPQRLFANILKQADAAPVTLPDTLHVLGARREKGIQHHFESVGVVTRNVTKAAELPEPNAGWLLIPEGSWTAELTEPVLKYIAAGGHVWLMDWESKGFEQLDKSGRIRPLSGGLQRHSLLKTGSYPALRWLGGFECFWAEPTQGGPKPLASLVRHSLAPYGKGSRINLDAMELELPEGAKNVLTTWGVPEGFTRAFNTHSATDAVKWTVPADRAGNYYIGLTARVAQDIPKTARQLSVAFVTQPFSWSLAGGYKVSVNGQPVALRNTGDSVQVPITAKGWAMPYGCMVSKDAVELKAGDVVSIQTTGSQDLWVAGLDLFKPRGADDVRPLTDPGVLSQMRYGKGEVLLDGIDWSTGFEKASRSASMMLNHMAIGMNLAFAPFELKVHADGAASQRLAREAVLEHDEGVAELHLDGTPKMHGPFRGAVALKTPGQWATWKTLPSLAKGSYKVRVVARVSNTSPANMDLAGSYVLKVGDRIMPLVLDTTAGEAFVALQAQGWAIVYGTLRGESPLELGPGDSISVGLNKSADAFVPMIQLIPANAAAASSRVLPASGGVELPLNRTIDIQWPEADATVPLKTSLGLVKEHPSLTLDPGGKTFRRLLLLQSFYHPYTDFAGQSVNVPVARATVRYADGAIETFDIVYYQHVTMPLDSVAVLPQATRVWSGEQPFKGFLDDFTSQKGRWIQTQHPTPIYAMRWDNPHPEKPVASIDLSLTLDGVLILFQARSE